MPIGKPLDYVARHYGVPAAIGRRVIAYGKPGIIVADRGHYIGVTLDDDPKRHISNYHPTHGIEYGDMAEKLPKPRRRTNFDEFEDSDCGLYFHEFLGINMPRYEDRGGWRDREYRMYRRQYSYSGSYRDVEGEWAPTMKAAKASYKAALKTYRASLRTSLDALYA